MYGIVRIYVALLEYLFTWVGEQKVLRQKLRDSVTYEEWIENAINLDKYLTLDKWSFNPKFSYYDYKTINLTIQKIKRLRRQENDAELMLVLQSCLKSNFAGIENRQLYSHRYFGTKNLIQTYVNTVVDSINYIADSKNITLHSKRHFFKIVLKNYGKTALVLSGGACFAYTHFGIVKALLDQDLLPNIISGTSGGGLIAALACTRSNEELKELLVPQLAKKITACEDPWYIWIPRFWRTGARFDAVGWARKANFFTRGSTTFQEAFERTGRKLNISTVPADPHSPVILCNSITSPNCIIWSALLASSAVPGILNPVVLMMKSHAGDIVPFSLGNKWRDGSLRTDIPIDALNTYYNVNFLVVSQVNPHISLFFFAPKGTVGRPVARRKVSKGKYSSLRGGFIATALEQLFKLEITKWLQMVKTLDLLPNLLEQDWLNIWLQRFTGSITIWPRNKLKDFWYILSDPTEERLGEMILKGERSMFPRILFIRNRIVIERAIERGRKASKLSTKIDNTIDLGTGGNDFQFHSVEYDDDSDFDDHEYEAESSDCPPRYSKNEFNSEYLTDTTNTTVEDDEEVIDSDAGRFRGESDAEETLLRHRRNTIF
jgi:predicted acylesterase/phospholipase RssA